MDIKATLEGALDSIDVDPDKLAYFALTSKPESQVRDRLAYRLHQQLSETDLQVAREWRRTDLAVLEGDGKPVALVEVKACPSWDACKEPRLARYRGRVWADIHKASTCAKEAGAPEAEIYALLVVTHLRDAVPSELRHVVKYSGPLRAVTCWEDTNRSLRQFLPDASPHVTMLGEGKAFGLTTVVTTWLFGPVLMMDEGDAGKAPSESGHP
jgi:hypothetical protein